MIKSNSSIPADPFQFYSDLDLHKIKHMLKNNLPVCERCKVERKSHYCIEKLCKNKSLICVECENNDIYSIHYSHNFSYVLPLLIKNVFANVSEIFDSLNEFKFTIAAEIVKIHNYIKSLERIGELIDRMLADLIKQKLDRRLDKYQSDINSFFSGQTQLSLHQIFHKIDFITNQECKNRNQLLKKELNAEINKLVWLVDPQKHLKEMIAEKDEPEIKQQFVFSCTKPIEVCEVDNNFKLNYEVFTNKFKYNPLSVRLQYEYCNKAKMFETLLYHFKKCKKLCLINAPINQIKTPLGYNNLRSLEYICNPQSESYCLKLEQETKITSFTIKKLKEEDSRFLKYIRTGFPQLMELHIDFINKFDLANNKDLVEFFKGEDDKLRRLTLKIRTESEIKKLYGHFAKFYKESYQNSLEDALISYLHKHQALTRLNIEGLKISKCKELLECLKDMKNLFEFKLVLDNPADYGFANIKNFCKLLEKKCLTNRKLLTALTRMYKSSATNVYNRIITTELLDFVFI